MKDQFLNTQEILRFAILMEDEGTVFYENAAKKTSSTLSEFFTDLAHQEKMHSALFQKWYNELETTDDDIYLFMPEVTGYFQSFAKEYAFSSLEFNPDNIYTTLKLAIRVEENTVALYEHLLLHATESTKPTLERLIKEEKEHIVKLTDAISTLQDKN